MLEMQQTFVLLEILFSAILRKKLELRAKFYPNSLKPTSSFSTGQYKRKCLDLTFVFDCSYWDVAHTIFYNVKL